MTWLDATDSDRAPSDLDRLRLAVAVTVARRIAEADGVLDASEVELLERVFPRKRLELYGFLDARGLLAPVVDALAARAVTELPKRLNLPQKLELITLFHRTVVVDGDIDPRELEILADEARKLQIPLSTFRKHLVTLGVGAPPPSRPP